MPFSKEESEEIKQQLLVQVDKLPNENKAQIKEYIKGLNDSQLEEFLKKNKIQISDKGLEQEGAEQEEPEEKRPSECIFCQIAKNKIPSYKIAENKKSISILEINPFSKGHSIILPLEHVKIEKMPKSSLSMAQKIAKKIKKKLKPEDVKIESSSFIGHAMINIIPIYKDTPLKKTQASEKELKELQKKLKTTTRAKRKKAPTKENTPKKPLGVVDKEDISKLPIIHFRIP
jgi:histidine triad (HIT) family protein